MSARDEAAGGVELLPCERCGVIPGKPFENLMDNPDDPDGDLVPVWTILHQCTVTQNDIWVTANNPADCVRRWNPTPSPRDQASSAMLATEARPATPYEFSKDWCLKSAEIEGDAEIGAGSLAALPTAQGVTEAGLAELFALMDEADSALDRDTYKQRLQDNFDAPDDAEYCVLMGTIRRCDALFRAIEKIRSDRAALARSAGIEPGEGG